MAAEQAAPGAAAARAAGVIEVYVAQRLDVASVRRCQAILSQALRRQPARLIVDLSDCPGVDATGIGVLLDAHRALWRQGSQLTLRAVPPEVWRMFVLARVDHVFDVDPGPAQRGHPSPVPPQAG
ncbi:STAS domain-containing protein [Dactylosporangium sp. AC04546]|uniref:STAS domain-containing protein n=1 Tax=Dactylosporangium sp. AC04546 TaxID=2862460 RepID=UPI001EE0A241|nr:STAS domain-containing protein [Dactylosporangium sp. AC04546]WVK78555.1 STAS domain-containing protein [Dactylosporangium sp. AC04546]